MPKAVMVLKTYSWNLKHCSSKLHFQPFQNKSKIHKKCMFLFLGIKSLRFHLVFISIVTKGTAHTVSSVCPSWQQSHLNSPLIPSPPPSHRPISHQPLLHLSLLSRFVLPSHSPSFHSPTSLPFVSSSPPPPLFIPSILPPLLLSFPAALR